MVLTLEVYNANSFVIRGNSTYDVKSKLKEKDGKYNSKLVGGPGWIFRIGFKEELQKFVDEFNNELNTNPHQSLPLSYTSLEVENQLTSLRNDYNNLMSMYRNLDERFNQLSMYCRSDTTQPVNKPKKNHNKPQQQVYSGGDDDEYPKPVGKKKRFL
jgi:hypothetical protein